MRSPDAENMGTWNDRLAGGRAHGLASRVVDTRRTAPASAASAPPARRAIFQTRAPFLGSYLALPWLACRSAAAAVGGTGMRTTTDVAVSDGSNAARSLTDTSTRVRPTSVTSGSSRNGRETPSAHR